MFPLKSFTYETELTTTKALSGHCENSNREDLIIIIIILIIILIITIAFKGTIQDFLQSPQCAANRLQHARSSCLGAIV